MITETTFFLPDPDGYEIFIYKWIPGDGQAKAVVQIAHGMAEHALRYRRFAEHLAAHGYVVYADDHRGHGKTAGTLDRAGLGGPNSWNGMVEDLKGISDHIRAEHPGLPLVLFGHSMGSFLAQQYLQTWGNELAAVILSGSTGALGNVEETVAGLDYLCQSMGRDVVAPSAGALFESLNAPFAPAKTGFEWLSRDEDEVQKYVDDPFCGFPFTNGMTADMFRGMQKIWSPEEEAKIPANIPVLLVSGAMDPVGGFGAGVQLLADRYKAVGVQDLTVKLYPEARHEILNETNRDEIQADILAWLDARV